MPEATNAVPVVEAPVRVLSADSEFRVSESECWPCAVLGIELPAAENFGVRWRWTCWTERGTGLCEFECLAPFLLFVSASGTKFCYTSEEYSAHLQLLHSELFPAKVVVSPPPPMVRPALPVGANTTDARVFPGGYTREIAGAGAVVGIVFLLAVCL